MKIVNVVLNGNFTDSMAYQENCLPYYQKKIYNAEVSIISGQYCLKKGSNLSEMVDAGESCCENGIRLVRLPSSKNNYLKRFSYYPDLYNTLCKEKPDIIFAHLIQSLSFPAVVKYKKKHPNVKVFADSHSDYVNSANNTFSKVFLHKFLWKRILKSSVPYVEKFYGVLPARVDFLREIYELPKDKTELLLMGAEDEKINFENAEKTRLEIRNQYSIQKNDVVLITGGKLDQRKNVRILIDAVEQLHNDRIKVFLFGKPDKDNEDYIQSISRKENVIYLGWITSDEMYRYFHASDLAVFPGTHSVLWEQAVGTGLPGVFKKWEGIDHIDQGGNIHFLYNESSNDLREILEGILCENGSLAEMKKIADTKKSIFLYSEIARKSISI